MPFSRIDSLKAFFNAAGVTARPGASLPPPARGFSLTTLRTGGALLALLTPGLRASPLPRDEMPFLSVGPFDEDAPKDGDGDRAADVCLGRAPFCFELGAFCGFRRGAAGDVFRGFCTAVAALAAREAFARSLVGGCFAVAPTEADEATAGAVASGGGGDAAADDDGKAGGKGIAVGATIRGAGAHAEALSPTTATTTST